LTGPAASVIYRLAHVTHRPEAIPMLPDTPPLSRGVAVTRGVWSEFRGFLLKQNVVALAIAVVIGTALNGVVKSLVDDIIMPIVTVALPAGAWQTYKWQAGPFAFGIGNLLSAILNFLIVGFVAWRIAKAFIKPEPEPVVPATKPCQFCRSAIDPAATRCPHCTSQLAA
jgi:large conductance mechanosensitive channel